jgi:hypothetical protein
VANWFSWVKEIWNCSPRVAEEVEVMNKTSQELISMLKTGHITRQSGERIVTELLERLINHD